MSVVKKEIRAGSRGLLPLQFLEKAVALGLRPALAVGKCEASPVSSTPPRKQTSHGWPLPV